MCFIYVCHTYTFKNNSWHALVNVVGSGANFVLPGKKWFSDRFHMYYICMSSIRLAYSAVPGYGLMVVGGSVTPNTTFSVTAKGKQVSARFGRMAIVSTNKELCRSSTRRRRWSRSWVVWSQLTQRWCFFSED